VSREEWLRGMDSNHDNQLQRLVSYQLDDPGIDPQNCSRGPHTLTDSTAKNDVIAVKKSRTNDLHRRQQNLKTSSGARPTPLGSREPSLSVKLLKYVLRGRGVRAV
jgi:hypothetical protein